MIAPAEILEFWFGPLSKETDYPAGKVQLWFRGGERFDREIEEKFGGILKKAAAGGLADWEKTPRERLALIIVLDQFSRNAYRGKPESFAQDARALRLALDAIEKKWDRELYPVERVFLYMPLMHSEDVQIQEKSITCYERLVEDSPVAIKMAFDVNLDFALKHKAIIDRFGRYPHRNKVLGRASTTEEEEFLKQPGSSF